MLLKVEDHQKLLMLSRMDDLYIEDEYPRRSTKFYKPALKGEKENLILKKWIETLKYDIRYLINL